MKTDVVFHTHQEVGFRSLNAVAELTHLLPVAPLWVRRSMWNLTRPPRWSISMPSHQPVTAVIAARRPHSEARRLVAAVCPHLRIRAFGEQEQRHSRRT